MQFKTTLDFGHQQVEISGDGTTQTDILEQVSFFTGLPTEGPNGEKDVIIKFKTTKEGHKYYSLVSPSAKLELQLGQYKQPEGALFVKGDWQPLYDASQNQAQAGANIPQPQAVPQYNTAPIPMPQQAAPVAAPQPQAIPQPLPQQVVQQPVPVPQPLPQQQAAPVAAPQSAAVTDIQAKYNLNK